MPYLDLGMLDLHGSQYTFLREPRFLFLLTNENLQKAPVTIVLKVERIIKK